MLELKIDTSMYEKQGLNKAIDTLLFNARLGLIDIMKRDIEPFVPMNTGRLREETFAFVGDDDIAYIDYDAPYAPYVYNMGDGVHYTTPGTSGHWEKEATKVNGFKWVVDFANIVKKMQGKSGVGGWNLSSGGVQSQSKSYDWNIEFEHSWDLMLSKL